MRFETAVAEDKVGQKLLQPYRRTHQLTVKHSIATPEIHEYCASPPDRGARGSIVRPQALHLNELSPTRGYAPRVRTARYGIVESSAPDRGSKREVRSRSAPSPLTYRLPVKLLQSPHNQSRIEHGQRAGHHGDRNMRVLRLRHQRSPQSLTRVHQRVQQH